MARNEEPMSLRDLPPSHEQHGTMDETQDADRAASRKREARKRALVLVGSAISQLPIWGFAMNYGVFQQEYESTDWDLRGGREATGVIGTTSNGVMYLSMPLLFAILSRRWAGHRRLVALCGVALACASFLLSSLSTHVWHLVATQGVLSALGCALIYSPLTLSLGEWFGDRNRAVAYAVTLSCKNVVGSVCPFLLRALLDRFGFRNTLRIWTAVVAASSVLAIALVPTHPSRLTPTAYRVRDVPWQFLRHKTFYIYSVAIALQSAGYGIPQTYLNTYAHDVLTLSTTTATLLLTLFNIPGIFASSFFGWLTDNAHFRVSTSTATAVAATSSALSAFLLWGLSAGRDSTALLIIFSITFGFFAGGYSATWGGVINELEGEAAQRNEAVDTGLLYGLLNGARGVGYVSGGLAGVPLLKAGSTTSVGILGYGTSYGPLIIFTGLSSMFGGWGVLWKGVEQLTRHHRRGPAVA